MIRLHLGGTEAKPGWTLLNVLPGPGVDIVGDCADLSAFADGTVAEIYASHVYEHLGFRQELPKALREAYRVLAPGGELKIAVPDLDIICRMWASDSMPAQARETLMCHLYGDQTDAHDFHRVGFNWDILTGFLARAGFAQARRVEAFGLFEDTSAWKSFGVPISLNVVATKAA